MSGDQQLLYLSWALYLAIFGVVAVRAARSPTRANVDIALFFGASALVILLSTLFRVLGTPAPLPVADLSAALLMALPYLLLRLVADFAGLPALVVRAAELGLGVSVVLLVAIPPPLPVPAVLLLVAYFVVVMSVDTGAFLRAAGRSRGVTRRRMQAAAIGSGFLGLDILTAAFGAVMPEPREAWSSLARLFGLASGVSYYVGFAPPTWLRRAWQEPELRALLGRAAALPRLPGSSSIVRELERGAAASIGAPGASIGLWDEAAGVLRFSYNPSRYPERAARLSPDALGARAGAQFVLRDDAWEATLDHPISGRTFREQRPLFTPDSARADPANADAYRAFGAIASLTAPITAGERRLGVLLVHAPSAPIFAESDLELVQLLADQAAVILESRALIDAATRIQAREETARLKEDFISSAAHDLKTPLSGMLMQAQLMLRRASRDPSTPADQAGLERLIREGTRLKDFVLELLDASRLEQGALVGHQEEVDLSAVANDVCRPEREGSGRVRLEAESALVGTFDRARIAQLLDNLVDNALKYSPAGGEVRVRLWRQDEEARISVTDQGIGIPSEDTPRLFDRFYRGENVDDRQHAGLGLGLYICRGIAEQHGGRIWAESSPGLGSTFHVALPLNGSGLRAPAAPSAEAAHA